MKRPFEQLMEFAASLSDEDADLPMGRLAERWGEPVQRIADALSAVRVMNGERTYTTVGAPEPEPEPCRGFRWIGQAWTSCDACGEPAWEHDGMLALREDATIASAFSDENWEVRLWRPGIMERMRRDLEPHIRVPG